MVEHNGYHAGHVWYLLSGGHIPKLSEILAEAATSNGYRHDEIQKAGRLPEPRRSAAIGAMRSEVQRQLVADARVYAAQCRRVRYRRRWLGPWSDEHRDVWSEPCCAAMLKFNHLLNGFAHLRQLDGLERKSGLQLDLFA